MSREIQLSTNSPAAADFWTQGGNALIQTSPVGPMPPAAPAAAPRSPMKKAHRLLRGRYPLAIVLAAVGAAAGAVAGYTSVPPKYAATGVVWVDDLLIRGEINPAMIPNANGLAQTEMGLLKSTPVIADALKDEGFKDAWRGAYGSTPMPTVTEFATNIDIVHPKGDGLISASFSDRNKTVAEQGTQALFHAFIKNHSDPSELTGTAGSKLFINRELDKIEGKTGNDGELAALNSQLHDLGRKYQTLELGANIEHAQAQVFKLTDDLNTTTIAYNEAIKAQNEKKPGTVDRKLIYLAIARQPDRMMQEYLFDLDRATRNMEEAEHLYGKNHRSYQDAARQLADAQKKVDDYANAFIAMNPTAIPMVNDGSVENVAKLAALKTTLEAELAKAQAEANAVTYQKEQIAEVQAKIQTMTARRDDLEKRKQILDTQDEYSHPVRLIDPGLEAVVDDKKRKLAAGVGLMFGGLVPIGLLMLYGLTENRFRYSDDANADDLAGVTLLGILPNLPDRLSDPQQAGVAAHCVHQIRTMLQISRSNDEPQVIAVTSAAPGDGKTSLTLALGLSYAACGARTLLIDCDLIAAGLTHRLNVSSPDGVLEAVANRALLEYVRTTDIADVAILPVGTTHAHHASTLSPVALRRLLSEAKKQFDIIIVDTGPILGSIEASLVCAASDRTILTVARNQQRPLVERSIGHLQSIGSNLAGVVFNRAQARDFERSMNGLALRSRPPAPSGSTAKAVAGSFKRAG